MSAYKVPISPLGQFFGGYLHQDFADFHPSAWTAVEDFVANEPLERRQAARAELGQLLASCHTEQELSDAMDRVHLDYHPPGEGFTYRGWLENVKQYLATTRPKVLRLEASPHSDGVALPPGVSRTAGSSRYPVEATASGSRSGRSVRDARSQTTNP